MQETAKVVTSSILPHFLIMYTSVSDTNSIFFFYFQLVASIRNMVRQRTLLFEQLEVAEAMRAFISHRMSRGEELSAMLEQADNDLAAT